MTSLQIVPKWKDKSARFKGTVAAGEHVAVSIVNDNGEGGAYVASTEHLRLRVVGYDGRVLAQFPMPETLTDAEEVLPTSELEGEGETEGETEGANDWGSDTTPLQCELNLNTVQMLKAVPPEANVPLLFVLDDIEAKTLYFKDRCEVTHWPRRCGEDEPVDLDGYADFVANITEELAEFKAATNAAMSAESETRSSGDSALGQRMTTAEAAITSLGNGKADAATTLAGYGITDAKIDNGTITLGANTITPLTQHQDISGKADKSDTYTKTEVDSLVAATGGKFIVVQTLPSAASADPKAVYLVPRTTSETGNVYDEYLRVEPTSGTYAWEKIGSTDIDLSDYVQKETGKGLSTNDYTTAEKTKLAACKTKAEIDAGWWSEWTTSPAAPSGKYVIIIHDSANGQYNVWIGDSEDAWQDGPPDAWVDGATGNESTISFTLNGTPYTATRHRVAAPIPAKTSDLTNDSGFLTQHQQLVPIYSQNPTYSWEYEYLTPKTDWDTPVYYGDNNWVMTSSTDSAYATGDENATRLEFYLDNVKVVIATYVRTDIVGYTLGAQSGKPLQPKGSYAPSAHTHAQGDVTGLTTALAGKADKPATFTTGNLAALDAQGNPTDSTIPAANVALKGNIPYDLGTPTVINAASSETVEGETVNYGAATLADRTANIVQVTATLDELRITFPAATSGKVRDFGLRVEIGTGSAALTAPSLVPPAGVTLENADAEIPALADGTATAKGVTLLYFCETAPGVFVVKGEQIEEVA